MATNFFCLCMSPALDATVRLPFAPRGAGEIFKDVAEDVNVGGKAVNVARWLALRGAEVECGGLLGEDNDKPFVKELAKYSIADRFVRVPGATRRNEMLTWPGGSVKLNRAAFPGLGNVERGTGNGFFDEVLSSLSQDNLHSRHSLTSSPLHVAILSGSLPPCCPKSFYADVVKRLKGMGFNVVLDASGNAMRLALDAGPDLIKPNAEECEPLVGFIPKTPEDFAKATELLQEKAAHVIISDGGAGAWFDGEFVAAPKVDVVDTTAAGDTLLAEYCWRTYGVPCEVAAKWAVSAGSAACTMPGGAPPPTELVGKLAEALGV